MGGCGVVGEFLSSTQTSIPSKAYSDSSKPISQSKTNDFVELCCHTGRGNSTDSHKKKEPVNYFPPASKTRTTKKKKVCVYVWCFCVVLEPDSLGWFLLCMCECKHYVGSTAVRSCATV